MFRKVQNTNHVITMLLCQPKTEHFDTVAVKQIKQQLMRETKLNMMVKQKLQSNENLDLCIYEILAIDSVN